MTTERAYEIRKIPPRKLKASDQMMFEGLSLGLDKWETKSALIAVSGNEVPAHSRVPVAIIRKSEEGSQERLSIHIRHVPSDEINRSELNNEISDIGTPRETLPVAKEGPFATTEETTDVIGGHAKGFVFTGEIMKSCMDLTVTRGSRGVWKVEGQGLNSWDDPQKALSFVRLLSQHPESLQWRDLPVAT